MARTWPSLRLWRRIAIGVIIVIIALLIALRLFAMSSMARNMVETRLEGMTVRGQAVELEGVKGDLLGQITVDRLRLRDADGVWLDAHDVALDWSPLSYLSQHLFVRDISATQLQLLRRPILSPSSSRGGGPARVTLDALTVSDLSLANGVAGPAQSYALSGQLRTRDRTGAIGIDLTPRSQSGDRIRAALDWGGDIPLRGEVDISGAPSGLIATVIQAPDDESVSGSLTAQGSLSDWQLQARGQIGNAPIIDLEVRREANAYYAHGDLALDTLGIFAPLQARLGSRMHVEGALSAARELSAILDAETLATEVTGDLTLLSNGIQIENLVSEISRANAPVLTGLSNLDLPEFALHGMLRVMSQERAFEGAVDIPRLAYGDYVGTGVASDGKIMLTPTGLEIETKVSATGLNGLPTELRAVMAGPMAADIDARYTFDDRTLRVFESEVENRALQATLQGEINLGEDIALAGTLSTGALPYLSEVAGSWSLTGPNTNQIRLKFDGELAANRASEILTTLIGTNAQISLSVLRDASRLNLESASLDTAALNATASGQIEDGQLSGRSQIIATTVTVSSATFENVSTDLTISGATASPDLQLTTTIGTLDYVGQTLTDLELLASARLGGNNAYELTASANFMGESLDLDLQGRRDTAAVIVDRLNATWDTLIADGAGQIAMETPRASQFDINIAGRVADLGTIDADIAYQDEVLAGNITLQEADLGPLSVENATSDLSGRWPRFTGELTYVADLTTPGGPQPLTGAHGVHANLSAQTFELDGAATLADQTIAFVSPLVVDLDSGLNVSGQLMAFGGQLDLALEPLQTGQSTVRISNVSVQKLGPLLNRPALLGRLDGEASLRLLDGQLSGTARGSIDGLTRDGASASATDLTFNADINADTLSATLQTEESGRDLNFIAQASVPLQHSQSLSSIRPIPDAAIPVSITGDGPIEPLWAIAAPTDLRVDGRARVDVNNGTGESWRFQGPIQFEDGVFEDGITGIHLTDISVDAELRPDGVQVQSARASGRRSGYVEASGRYQFDGSGSVTLNLRRLNALNRSDISATLSGSAEIDRQNRRTSISGDLELDQARINLEKLPRAGYTTLDVVFADQVDENGSTAPAREAIALALNVSADRRIFVAGSGVDTEWGLTARVTGSPGRPNVIGRANLVRGEADLLSRRFRFSDGQVRFVGDPLESQLLIRADRTSDDVTSTITLSGSLINPEITLSSDPSLPNDEILSRVLFGRSPSELSPLQAAQLAGAAAQLAGGDALNLVGQLQEATGLDRLDIGLDDAGAATLSTGKYLSQDIYLEIESGVSGAPGVALEWTPLDNVAVDAEIDPELGPKVAIQWKRDFDRLPGEPDPE